MKLNLVDGSVILAVEKKAIAIIKSVKFVYKNHLNTAVFRVNITHTLETRNNL